MAKIKIADIPVIATNGEILTHVIVDDQSTDADILQIDLELKAKVNGAAYGRAVCNAQLLGGCPNLAGNQPLGDDSYADRIECTGFGVATHPTIAKLSCISFGPTSGMLDQTSEQRIQEQFEAYETAYINARKFCRFMIPLAGINIVNNNPRE